jgi:undecaprenyl-diphosphatase
MLVCYALEKRSTWFILAIGFVVSFIVAYGAVAWFLAWVKNHGFVPFAMYRLVIGAAVLAWVIR